MASWSSSQFAWLSNAPNSMIHKTSQYHYNFDTNIQQTKNKQQTKEEENILYSFSNPEARSFSYFEYYYSCITINRIIFYLPARRADYNLLYFYLLFCSLRSALCNDCNNTNFQHFIRAEMWTTWAADLSFYTTNPSVFVSIKTFLYTID